jgi:hypothetical protein
MVNPYDPSPEVDDDDLRRKERQRKLNLTHLIVNALLLAGLACSLSGKATEAAIAFVMAAIILSHDCFAGDR